VYQEWSLSGTNVPFTPNQHESKVSGDSRPGWRLKGVRISSMHLRPVAPKFSYAPEYKTDLADFPVRRFLSQMADSQAPRLNSQV